MATRTPRAVFICLLVDFVGIKAENGFVFLNDF
jgi:hypothetical protein